MSNKKARFVGGLVGVRLALRIIHFCHHRFAVFASDFGSFGQHLHRDWAAEYMSIDRIADDVIDHGSHFASDHRLLGSRCMNLCSGSSCECCCKFWAVHCSFLSSGLFRSLAYSINQTFAFVNRQFEAV